MHVERWLPAVGYDGVLVSSRGRVKGVRRGEMVVLRHRLDLAGYPTVKPNSRAWRVRVHRLVLEAFVGPCPAGGVARHLDDIKTNNSLENLAWGEPKENAADAIKNGRMARGEKHGQAKLTEAQVREIKALRAVGISQQEVADRVGVHRTRVSFIDRGANWAHVSGVGPPRRARPSPRKYSDEIVVEIRRLASEGVSVPEIVRHLGVGRHFAYQVVAGKARRQLVAESSA